jgi:hypothetical protein
VTLTAPDFIDDAARHAVNTTYPRFADYTDRADVEQEVRLYVLGDGAKHIAKWVADDEKFRITRALCGVARQYCEREKAARSGYSFDDIAWYSPEKLAELVPLALSAQFDGLTGDTDQSSAYGSTDGAEGGTLLAMIADVRRALGQANDWANASDFDPETDVGLERLTALADRLGGEFPGAPSYRHGRRAMSNSRAISLTQNGYNE